MKTRSFSPIARQPALTWQAVCTKQNTAAAANVEFGKIVTTPHRIAEFGSNFKLTQNNT